MLFRAHDQPRSDHNQVGISSARLLQCFKNRHQNSPGAANPPGSPRARFRPSRFYTRLNTNIAAIAFLDIDLPSWRDGGLPCR